MRVSAVPSDEREYGSDEQLDLLRKPELDWGIKAMLPPSAALERIHHAEGHKTESTSTGVYVSTPL
jgi:hypothetical protein